MVSAVLVVKCVECCFIEVDGVGGGSVDNKLSDLFLGGVVGGYAVFGATAGQG